MYYTCYNGYAYYSSNIVTLWFFIIICSFSMSFSLLQKSIYNNLHKRLQNVRSPLKRRTHTREGPSKKKKIQVDFSSSDKEDYDADTSGGSTVILQETPGSSSDDGHTASCKLILISLGNIESFSCIIINYRHLYFTIYQDTLFTRKVILLMTAHFSLDSKQHKNGKIVENITCATLLYIGV